LYKKKLELHDAECLTDLEKLDLVQFANGGLVLGLSHFLKLLQLPQKMLFD